MAFFMIEGNYAPGVARTFLNNPQQDRPGAVRALAEQAGGHLHAFFYALGESDFVVILELPSNVAAAAISLTVGAIGHVSHYRTHVLLAPPEAMQAMQMARDLRLEPPR